MPEQRKKLLLLSDHPLVPSGVGVQAKMTIEGLLKTERYKFICFGGAIKHPDYTPQQIAPDQFGEMNWVIVPVDGHGNKEQLRAAIRREKPDAIVLFTDPRFFHWVWEIEDEIRAQCPIVYWHVWDNDPIPDFNRTIYESNDQVLCLSLKTYGIFQGLGFDKERYSYVPHSEPSDMFKPVPVDQVRDYRRQNFGPYADKEFLLFWNNRNARRKMTGDVLDSFARFARKVGKHKVGLLMHTSPSDQEGQDIHAVVKKLGMEDCVFISEQRISSEQLNMLYNCCDATINIASNEGFGLATLESLYAGTPVILNMTGGLQFQIGDWWSGFDDFSDQDKMTAVAKKKWSSGLGNWWGVPVFPAARNMVGSQSVPYIYDDRVNDDDVVKALEKMYSWGHKKRERVGQQASEWAREKFGQEQMIAGWDAALTKAIEQHRVTPHSTFRCATI